MNRLFFLFIIFMHTSYSYAQTFPVNSNEEIEFSEVVEVPLPKEKLHSNAKEWVALTFGDYKRVIQFEDNENCKLIIKGVSVIDYLAGIPGMTTSENIGFTITLESKDNRFRYKINDIVVNQEVKIFGSIVRPKPFCPTKHINSIESYSLELDKLESTDITKIKNKALKEHQDKIADYHRRINEEKIFYQKEFDAILNIIESLKISMNVNDDF